MPGILDAIMQLTGRPDPTQQMAAGLGQGPGQPGSPQGPQPLAGAPAPPGGAAGPGGASAPPGAPPAGGAAAPPPQQGPQAYQTQPDLGQMFVQLTQRAQANEQFNRGLGLLTASLTRDPQERNLIMQSMTGQTQDPGAMMNNLIKLQQYQQGQQRLAGLQAAIPGLVKSGVIGPEMVPILQNNPAMIESIIQSRQPEGAYRNWGLARDDFVSKNSDPNDPQSVARARATFEQQNPLINVLTPAGGDPGLNQLNLEKNAWQAQHPGEALPDDGRFNSPEALTAYKTKVAALSNSQTAAASTFPALDGSVVTMRKNAQDISQDPDLENVLNLSPGTLIAARKGGYGAELAQGLGMTPHQLQLLHQIDELKNTDTSQLKTANPHLLSSFQPIDADLNGLGNFEVGADNFKTRLTSLGNDLTTLRAQGIGASGQIGKALDKTPDGQSLADDQVGAKIDPSYLPGGANYLGEPKRLTPQLITWAKQQIAAGTPRSNVILHLKLGGYLPKGEF